jgi:uncharacterized protein YjbI with pentapeptide repeats
VTARGADPPEALRLEGELAELALGPGDLAAGAHIERARMAAAELAGVRAGGVELREVRLVDVDLDGARLTGLRLADVAVERGNLANLAAPEPSLRRVAVTGARLTGAQWTRGTIADAVFRDCRLDLATFAGTTFERTCSTAAGSSSPSSATRSCGRCASTAAT